MKLFFMTFFLISVFQVEFACQRYLKDIKKDGIGSYMFFLLKGSVSTLKNFPFNTMEKLQRQYAGDFAKGDKKIFEKAVKKAKGFENVDVSAYIEGCTKKLPMIPYEKQGTLLCNVFDTWYQLHVIDYGKAGSLLHICPIKNGKLSDDYTTCSLDDEEDSLVLLASQDGSIEPERTSPEYILHRLQRLKREKEVSTVLSLMKQGKQANAVIYVNNHKQWFSNKGFTSASLYHAIFSAYKIPNIKSIKTLIKCD